MKDKKISAGLLMYRLKNGVREVLLVHPGGPYWAKRDDGAWGIPKGEADNGETTAEELLEVAKHEFEEETGVKAEGSFLYLTKVERSDGKKSVEAWAFEGDCDCSKIKSNLAEIEWPPKSGKKIQIPEIDRGEFFTLEEAKRKVVPYQWGIIEAFEK